MPMSACPDSVCGSYVSLTLLGSLTGSDLGGARRHPSEAIARHAGFPAWPNPDTGHSSSFGATGDLGVFQATFKFRTSRRVVASVYPVTFSVRRIFSSGRRRGQSKGGGESKNSKTVHRCGFLSPANLSLFRRGAACYCVPIGCFSAPDPAQSLRPSLPNASFAVADGVRSPRDYSLEMLYGSRPRVEGEMSVTTRFPSGSIGFS